MSAKTRWLALAALGCSLAGPSVSHAQLGDADFEVTEVEPGTFAVYRARPEAHAIEGFVVDSHALVDTLRKRVLEEQGLGNLAHVTAALPQRTLSLLRSR